MEIFAKSVCTVFSLGLSDKIKDPNALHHFTILKAGHVLGCELFRPVVEK